MSFLINPLSTTAAEIVGLDCARPFPEPTLRMVRKAWLDHPVLIFRDQDPTARQFAAFGRQFGTLEEYGSATGKPKTAALKETGARETPDQMLYVSPEDTDVLIMTNEIREGQHPVGVVDNAETWHSDGSHKSLPYQAIIVHVLKNPTNGGDTEFCDMREVYRKLPPDIKAALEDRQAAHHWSKSINPRFAATLDDEARAEGDRIARMIPEVLQPIVRTHPETGVPSLYISPRFTLRIDGLPKDLSDTILNTLFAIADDPSFHYRHEWREKDLMIWDNRNLNHRVCSYPAAEVRRRHRVTVMGDRPFHATAAA